MYVCVYNTSMVTAAQIVIIVTGLVYTSEIREAKMNRSDDRPSCRFVKIALIGRSSTTFESA